MSHVVKSDRVFSIFVFFFHFIHFYICYYKTQHTIKRICTARYRIPYTRIVVGCSHNNSRSSSNSTAVVPKLSKMLLLGKWYIPFCRPSGFAFVSKSDSSEHSTRSHRPGKSRFFHSFPRGLLISYVRTGSGDQKPVAPIWYRATVDGSKKKLL